MMKRKYLTPTLIIQSIKKDDVLTTSEPDKENDNSYIDVFDSIFRGEL